MHIGKDDLRLKLMRKNASRRAHSDDYQELGDLREKLSKPVRLPVPGIDSRVPSIDSRQRLPEPKDSGVLGRIPSTRSVDDMPQVDSFKSPYSSWTLDHLRRRSPDRVLATSSGISPQNVEELQRRPLNRTFNDVRPIPYISKDLSDTTRPMGAVNFMSNSTLPPGPAKPMAPHLNQHPPPSGTGVVSKGPYMVGASCSCIFRYPLMSFFTVAYFLESYFMIFTALTINSASFWSYVLICYIVIIVLPQTG